MDSTTIHPALGHMPLHKGFCLHGTSTHMIYIP